VPATIQVEVLSRLDGTLCAAVIAFARQYGVPLVDVHEIGEGER